MALDRPPPSKVPHPSSMAATPPSRPSHPVLTQASGRAGGTTSSVSLVNIYLGR